MRLSLSLVLLITAAIGCPDRSLAQDAKLGTIEFPTSGPADAQKAFVRGVLYMHSFEYPSAADQFRKAQELDPGFAMAYWGEAMSFTHPVWNEQNLQAARDVLNRLAPTREGRQSKAGTPREKMYLDAVEILYADGKKASRDTSYSAAMKRIVDAFPEDNEAKAFYALSLLGLNQGVRDVKTYLRAGEIEEKLFRSHPDHPGAAHYVIHSFDDPEHAPRGLDAARAYSKIAPGAAHAQHMTTHIFLAMGMWDEVVSQNEIAVGHNHDAWTPHHYTSWLHYAYLQQGRYADALRMIEGMLPSQGKTLSPRQLRVLTGMRARHIIETEEWGAAPARWSATDAPVPDSAQRLWTYFSGYRAAKLGDLATARSHLARLGDLNRSAGKVPDAEDSIAELELDALVRLKEGKAAEAVALMRRATATEDATPVEFGPPVVIKPTHELLGEILLETGMAGEAQREFARALKLTPGRARSLLGLAKASEKMGDSATAAKAYSDLRAVWHRADASVLPVERR